MTDQIVFEKINDKIICYQLDNTKIYFLRYNTYINVRSVFSYEHLTKRRTICLMDKMRKVSKDKRYLRLIQHLKDRRLIEKDDTFGIFVHPQLALFLFVQLSVSVIHKIGRMLDQLSESSGYCKYIRSVIYRKEDLTIDHHVGDTTMTIDHQQQEISLWDMKHRIYKHIPHTNGFPLHTKMISLEREDDNISIRECTKWHRPRMKNTITIICTIDLNDCLMKVSQILNDHITSSITNDELIDILIDKIND